ncbi:DNA repair protein Rad60 [Aphomia sociella]
MSSDSEDDCYGNIAQKLQSMKNKYKDDKIECTNLLNESTTSTSELDVTVNKTSVPAKSEVKNIKEIVLEIPDNDEKDSSEIFIDNLLAASSKRVTRAGSKKEVYVTQGRRGGRASVGQTRPRGRSRRGRGRHSQPVSINNAYPIFSVGNTDEYPDQSDNQQLFSKPNKEIVLIDEDDPLDDNEELSVKVYWQSSELFKFPIRKYQKLIQIFNYFSKKENISQDKLLLTYNDKVLKPDDTPDSINYSIAKFIDGGIVNQSVSKFVTSSISKRIDGITIKFQCQNIKKPFETTVRPEDKLSLAMMKCAEHFEMSIDKLRFEFDGDSISGKTTPKDLELEGGECIDVKIMS